MAGDQHFDFIIIGAGSAGCALANRLSADQAARVLLLEAGGRDWDPLIHVPLGSGKILAHDLHNWRFHFESESGLNGRALEAARGKVLGGSSSINVMAFTRGNPADYDSWARHGAIGWSYRDVLPYFRRSETWQGGDSQFRGGLGPIGVEFARTKDPLYDAWIEAGIAAGYGTTEDYNGEHQEGFGRSQYSIRNGHRSSSSNAYLHPVSSRKNLVVRTKAQTTGLILRGTTAVGVQYVRKGLIHRVFADREIVLSAGTFCSPQILMLSGIGPAEHLRSHYIKPVIDLPVGKNLQDHLGSYMMYDRQSPGDFHVNMRFDRMVVNFLRAYFDGTGPATAMPGGLHAFIKTEPDLEFPNIEFQFRGLAKDVHLWVPGIRPAYLDGFGIRPTMLHPKSRGEVLLRSNDPLAPPRLVGNFLSEPSDIETLKEGFRRADDLAHQTPMDKYRSRRMWPDESVRTDDEVEAWLRRTLVTAHHPAGTCPMGTGDDAVLDPELRVKGIDRLRVADASVMPHIISGHLNAPAIMIGEKAAAHIRGEITPTSMSTPETTTA